MRAVVKSAISHEPVVFQIAERLIRKFNIPGNRPTAPGERLFILLPFFQSGIRVLSIGLSLYQNAAPTACRTVSLYRALVLNV